MSDSSRLVRIPKGPSAGRAYSNAGGSRIGEEILETYGLIEAFGGCLEKLQDLCDNPCQVDKDELRIYLGELGALLNALDTDCTVVPIISEQILNGRKYTSKIERLGIASELIRLRNEEHKTISELQTRFGLNYVTIRRFFNIYDKSKPSERSEIRNNSITDIVSSLESIAASIRIQLARYQGQGDVHVKYIQALTELVKVAQKQQEAWAVRQHYSQLVAAIAHVLEQELPHKRKEVAEAFAPLLRQAQSSN